MILKSKCLLFMNTSIRKPQTKCLRPIWGLKTRKCAKSDLIPYLLYDCNWLCLLYSLSWNKNERNNPVLCSLVNCFLTISTWNWITLYIAPWSDNIQVVNLSHEPLDSHVNTIHNSSDNQSLILTNWRPAYLSFNKLWAIKLNPHFSVSQLVIMHSEQLIRVKNIF